MLTYRFLRQLPLVGLLLAMTACSPSDDSVSAEQAPSEAAPSVSSASSSAVNWPALTSEVKRDSALEARIDELLAQMTVEEKVGQIIQPEIKQVTPEDVRNYHLGSVLNGGGTTPNNDKYAAIQDWVDLADSYYQASIDTSDGRLGIPIMWGTDAVHGVGNVIGATLFPHNIALGATDNPALIEKIGWATARELAVTGIDWNFSPTVAVARDERWGRTYEAYSEDPEIVAAYAGPMVHGLQGRAEEEDFLGQQRVIATAKHFIGDGGTERGIDRGDTLGDERELRDIHGPGYFSAIEAGVQVVMASFTRWDGIRMHGHQYLLTQVLKEQMGFDGLVVGDWSGHGFIPGCTALDCPQAINAGLDIYMAPEPEWKTLFDNTVRHVNEGTITAARLDDAVRRILRVKLRAGLFDKGRPSQRPLAGDESVLGAAEHREIARQAVRESLVMLKNNDGLLPLSRQQHVLVAGDGADNIGKQTGGWTISWQGTGNANSDFPGATSIYQGIEAAVREGGGSVELSEIGEYAQKPDVAIVVFGENPYAEMQGDIPNLLYRQGHTEDLALLRQLQADDIPVVALFITGRPLWVNRELNATDAFVVIWQPGTEGAGVADVIFQNNAGEIHYDATGRLPFSWPARPDQYGLNRGDEDYQPLFAYGFGLSYADTDTLGDELSEEGLAGTETLEVLELFNRRPIDPWELEAIGAENDRQTMLSNTLHTSTVHIEAVDRNEQQDARRVLWNGEGPGQMALFTQERQDWSGYLRDKAALIFDLRVDHGPTEATYLRLGCGSYCASDIDVTESIRAHMTGQGWQTISVDLNCFPTSGDNFGVIQPQEEFITQVLQPFSIYTTGELELTFANVRLEKHKAEGAILDCQQ